MYKSLLVFTFITLGFFNTSCKSKISIDVKEEISKDSESHDEAAPKVTAVKLEGDQIIVDGSGFSNLQEIKVGNNTLSVVTATTNKLILSSNSAINLALNTALSLFIKTARGSAIVPVQFNLLDGSVTSSKLGITATTGQFLQYNGTAWQGTDLSSLTYRGAWNANSNTPTLDDSDVANNEYYIVDTSGTQDLGSGSLTFTIGDWIIHNGTNWQKINNSSGVKTVNAQTGDVIVSWSDVTAGSSLSDLGDVDTTGVAVNSVLKWDGSDWVIGTDNVGGNPDTTSSTTNSTIAADSDDNLSGEIRFQIGGSTQAVIDNNGNFGLGTASPSFLLHTQTANDTDSVFRFENSSNLGLELQSVGASQSPQLAFGSSGSPSLVIRPSGGCCNSALFRSNNNFIFRLC